jgi:hypothetical protein
MIVPEKNPPGTGLSIFLYIFPLFKKISAITEPPAPKRGTFPRRKFGIEFALIFFRDVRHTRNSSLPTGGVEQGPPGEMPDDLAGKRRPE